MKIRILCLQHEFQVVCLSISKIMPKMYVDFKSKFSRDLDPELLRCLGRGLQQQENDDYGSSKHRLSYYFGLVSPFQWAACQWRLDMNNILHKMYFRSFRNVSIDQVCDHQACLLQCYAHNLPGEFSHR